MQPSLLRGGLAATLSLALSACATAPAGDTWTPTPDSQGLNRAKYERDLADCRTQVAASPETDGAQAAKRGALRMGGGTAAVVGAAAIATGGLAILPLVAGSIATTAGIGAFAGGADAHQKADAKYRAMLSACLTGRGHRVLG